MPQDTPWTFHITTLGCKVNQYESQSIREAWTALGGIEVHDASMAHVALVNSCAITAKGERDTRNALYRLHRAQQTRKNALTILTGCAALLVAKTLKEMQQEYVYHMLMPAQSKSLLRTTPFSLPHCLHQQRPSNESPEITSPLDLYEEHSKNNATNIFSTAKPFGQDGFSIKTFQRSRPVLKVQDGCSHGCTYCIVPLVRGKSQSRPHKEILSEARQLLEAGHGEIILSGINLHHYGREKHAHEPQNFWELVHILHKEFASEFAHKARFRISSLEPSQLTTQGLDMLSSSTMLCPHIHLSLQHGSAQILRRMGRGHYALDALINNIATLRKHWSTMGLGADILMGFPGETEEDVQATMHMVSELNLTYAHVFPYSQRPGTAAANFAMQIPKQLRQERAAQIRAQVEEQTHIFLQKITEQAELSLILDTSAPGEETEKCSLHSLSDHKKLKHLKGAKAYKGVDAHYAPCRVFLPTPQSGIVRVRPLVVMDGLIHCQKIR